MTQKKPMTPRAKDMKYVNKGEDYEVYYAKNHPTKRTGYKNVQHAEVGGTKKMSTAPKKSKSKSGFGKSKTKSTSASSASSSKTSSSTKSKSTTKFSLKKGSKVSSKTNYLPHRKIDSIETKNGKKISSSQFVDGLYVKKGIKFATGGGVGKNESVIGFWLLNSPDGRKILKKSKKAEGSSAPSYNGFDNLKQNVIDYVLKNNSIKTPQGSVDYKAVNMSIDWNYIFENTKNKMAQGGGVDDLKKGDTVRVTFDDHNLTVDAKVLSVSGDNIKLSYFDDYYDKNITFTASKKYDYKNGEINIGDSSEIFDEMGKGGGISSSTTYLPNRKIKQATTTSGKVISSKNFIDGIYVKGKTKFGKGGGIGNFKDIRDDWSKEYMKLHKLLNSEKYWEDKPTEYKVRMQNSYKTRMKSIDKEYDKYEETMESKIHAEIKKMKINNKKVNEELIKKIAKKEGLNLYDRQINKIIQTYK